MGPPLAGSDVRAYVVTGGGLRLRGWLPRYRSRRVQMIFPLRGTEKRGLVSLEAKRRKVLFPAHASYGVNRVAGSISDTCLAKGRTIVDLRG